MEAAIEEPDINRLDDDLWMDKINSVKAKILELAHDPMRAELKEFHLMGLITPLLDQLGADPAIIVGGHAVELYTSGSYKTADVDMDTLNIEYMRETTRSENPQLHARFESTLDWVTKHTLD